MFESDIVAASSGRPLSQAGELSKDFKRLGFVVSSLSVVQIRVGRLLSQIMIIIIVDLVVIIVNIVIIIIYYNHCSAVFMNFLLGH